ncbi:unnamed protein product, partial [Allacma fusca]
AHFNLELVPIFRKISPKIQIHKCTLMQQSRAKFAYIQGVLNLLYPPGQYNRQLKSSGRSENFSTRKSLKVKNFKEKLNNGELR